MRRLFALVEGQTEETFVRQVLAPHLEPYQVFLRAIIISTRRKKDGTKFRGGLTRYSHLRKDLKTLLGDRQAGVTTMFDFYGLPADFPGLDSLPDGDPLDRAQHLEAALKADLGNPERFFPYLSVHELEALLLTVPETLAEILPGAAAGAAKLAAEVATFANPEEINDGETTHPSARILNRCPGFKKRLHGATVLDRIGLTLLRKRCPHFHEWITRLEGLG